jgi:hypothetical protein
MSAALLLLAASLTPADLPAPRLDRITPLGAAAGSTVEVDVIGPDLEEGRTLLFDHPGIKAEYLKDGHFRVTVGADVPAGTYDVRLSGKYGISSPRLFAVSHGLTEVAEKEPNHEPATAQRIAINSVINGMSDGNREDLFRFPLKRGQRVVVECQAQSLDSTLDATLTLSDADGKQLASNGDYNGRDPLIDFIAPRDGDYFVSIHDLSFRGGMPYRLVVTNRPHVENVFPRAVQVGRPATLTVYGRNLGPKAKPSTWTITDLPLDAYQETLTPPADVFDRGGYRFFEHPTTHSVLPTAATCTLIGFQFRPKPGEEFANPVPLLLTDTPVTLEVEPNDDPKKPQHLTLPAVVSGRFDRERDADWYEFVTAEAGQYCFEVYCERIGGRADAYLVVVDDKDNRVGELDDFGHRINAFDGHLRDPSGMVNLNAKTKYRVLVQDRYRRGGARYQYVLTIHKPVPDFYVACMHHHNPGPGGTTIFRGGATYLDIIIHHRDGFSGPITITAEGLPKGLHIAPTTIANDTRGTLLLWADADAPEWTGPIRLTATSRQGDVVLKRDVRPYTRVWNDPSTSSSRPTRDLVVAIRDTVPFGLRFTPERIEAEAGKKVELTLQVSRQWPDFKGSVNVIPLSFPGPITMGTVTIPEGKTEVKVTFDLQGGTRPGEYMLAVLGQAQVPFSKDAKAATKPNTLVSLPSVPIALVVKPPKK